MNELLKTIEDHRTADMTDDQLNIELVNQLCLGQSLGGYDITGVLIDVIAEGESDMGDSFSLAMCAMANGSGADKHSDTIIEMLTEWCEAKIAEYREWKQEQSEAL